MKGFLPKKSRCAAANLGFSFAFFFYQPCAALRRSRRFFCFLLSTNLMPLCGEAGDFFAFFFLPTLCRDAVKHFEESTIPNPQSTIKIVNPQSAIDNLKIQNPKFKIQNYSTQIPSQVTHLPGLFFSKEISIFPKRNPAQPV